MVPGCFLTPAEERMLCKQFEWMLRDFCKKFQPPMPRSVVGTSFNYFKRFYLHNSVMDYHPKHIMATCVYLACKVEEFNVSITQFVANIKGDRVKASDIILNNELLLMQQLNYHLTIHNPFRPVEGFLIDIKTRCPGVADPERFRHLIDDFLDRTFSTDACLLYAPSQIALAAVLYASNKLKETLETQKLQNITFITDSLFVQLVNIFEINSHLPGVLPVFFFLVKQNSAILSFCQMYKILFILFAAVWTMVKSIEFPQKDKMKAIEKKLEKCRNEENNPDSSVYKRKLQQMIEDEEEMEDTRKYVKLTEEQLRNEEQLLTCTSQPSISLR
ncbi:cyclin-H-like [Limulus polyphemus]|uniref:Cyclin-H n=1 Tax=Limulus polyphemus TaxID=6850 RepID=A0ABM1TRV3_LIMPO|nr:cyclin-H-like [Limulus polyphemus]